MKEFAMPLKGEAVVMVNNTNCASSVKSGSLQVFATPMMLALMEEATCSACASLLEDGETTVGTKVSVTHDKASPIGAVITAYATLDDVDGRKLIFSVYAKDDKGNIIGKGNIERFAVISNKFMKKVNS